VTAKKIDIKIPDNLSYFNFQYSMNSLRTETINYIFEIALFNSLMSRTVCLAVSMYDRASTIRNLSTIDDHFVTAYQAVRLAAMMENDFKVSLCGRICLESNPYLKKSLASTLGYRLGMKTPLDTIDEICYPAMEINNNSEPEMAAKKALCYYLGLLNLGLNQKKSTLQIACDIESLASTIIAEQNITENLYYRMLWTISELIPNIRTYAINHLKQLRIETLPNTIQIELPLSGNIIDWELESNEINVMKRSDMKKLNIFHTLFEGNNTLVKVAIPSCKSNITCSKIVVKTVFESSNKKHNSERSIQKKVFREISALSRLKSNYVVKLLGFYHDIPQKRYQLILANGGKTLENFLSENSDISLTLRRWLVSQLLEALVHIHSHHVVHNNLTHDNILIDSEYCLRIIGFGSAIILHSDHSFQKLRNGSQEFISYSDDVIAASVIIPRILCGREIDQSEFMENHALEYSIVYSMMNENLSASRALELFLTL
jgi:tRNA A-37 threonylcarbamoyl transferase component Bud32